MVMTEKAMLRKLIQDKNVRALCKIYFGEDITPLQAELIKKITFYKELGIKKISACCMTRWGKSYCVSRGIALNFLMKKIKVIFIGPKEEQARILRDYMAELTLKCSALLKMAQIDVSGTERIQKEASRKRMTYRNGCEYRVFSAEGDANRLMGHGLGSDGGIIVKDEATLISKEANAKISRMKGDAPENVLEIELFNPWDRDNMAFEHYTGGEWEVFHVGWKDAIKDGRTTEQFIEEQRKELLPLEFTVLYESNFPDEAEDSIFSLTSIRAAQKLDFDFEKELIEIEKILKEPHKNTEAVWNAVVEESKKFTRIISCDPADMGLDKMVMYWGTQREMQYEQKGHYSEPKSDPMQIVAKIIKKAEEFIGRHVQGRIILDRIGIGTGPLSRIQEVLDEKGYKNIRVVGAHFGETADKKDFYANKKAENYFRLQAMLNENMVKILDLPVLVTQLLAMKWDLTSANKKKIVDPESYSPDFCFIGNTLITTKNGDIPIKDIEEGMDVLTPTGFRKVLAKSCRKTDKLIRLETNKGNVLWTTPNHKIYTNERFIKAEELEYTNELENNSLINLLKWRIKSLLNTRERNIGFREQVDTSTGMFILKEKEKRKHFTGKFGKNITKRKFLKGLKSTILMEIPSIIRLKILNWRKPQSIGEGTWLKDLKIKTLEREIKNNWNKSEKNQNLGIQVEREEGGMLNIIRNLWLKLQRKNIFVNNVNKSLNQLEKKKSNSAQENVRLQSIGKRGDIVKIKNVLNVEKNTLRSLNSQKERPVQKDVLQFSEKEIKVYNLTIEEDNVYYANDLLVSNCDALVYFIWKEGGELVFAL